MRLGGGYFISMPDKKLRCNKPLYCIVTMPANPDDLKPDMGYYSPKELAAKEKTTTTSVYSWIDHGLPVMRSGEKGNIRIYYQDYIQWMIDCAMMDRPERDIPSWAFRFVKSTEPKRARNGRNGAVFAEKGADGAPVSEKGLGTQGIAKNEASGQLDLFGCSRVNEGGGHVQA